MTLNTAPTTPAAPSEPATTSPAAIDHEPFPFSHQPSSSSHQPSSISHQPSPISHSSDELLPAGDVARILRELAHGDRTPASLTPTLRRQCVASLTPQGYSNHEIAALLDIDERTLRRDRAALRADGALAPRRYLGDELLGEFQKITLESIDRLVRIAGDDEAEHYARLYAQEAIARIYQRFLETAHRLKYFESGADRLNHERDLDPTRLQRWRDGFASAEAWQRENLRAINRTPALLRESMSMTEDDKPPKRGKAK